MSSARPQSAGKIFGLGLSRTGTLSLTAALRRLGFETRHYPNDALTQKELKRGECRLTLLAEVDAVMDIPLVPYYAQLDAAYPGSKFILSTRPTEGWLRSVETHFRMFVDHRRDSFDEFVLASVYASLEFHEERFRCAKERHEADVRRYFADRGEDLLVIDISEGDCWEKLCGFLGRPVPDEPFPHSNKALSSPAARKPKLSPVRRYARQLRTALRSPAAG